MSLPLNRRHRPSLFLEAVVVCHHYDDFLRETLPHNISVLDNLVVVTSPEDTATQTLCKEWSVDFYTTDAVADDGDSFNKSAAINLGLARLKHNGFIIQLDADIVLPPQLRQILQAHRPDEDCIYGAKRFRVIGYSNWLAFEQDLLNEPLWRLKCLSVPPALSLGATLLHGERGYVPIGYFQLFHSKYLYSPFSFSYPEARGTAEQEDVLFALQWPRNNRRELPGLAVFHLESEPAEMGANWNGRKTKRFE
jgi:hypothetical protein